MGSKTVKPIEQFFGVVARVAEAAAAGAIREGARRARAVVRDVDGRLGKVQHLAEGELEPCAACGVVKREHEDREQGHAFVAPKRSRKRRRK